MRETIAPAGNAFGWIFTVCFSRALPASTCGGSTSVDRRTRSPSGMAPRECFLQVNLKYGSIRWFRGEFSLLGYPQKLTGLTHWHTSGLNSSWMPCEGLVDVSAQARHPRQSASAGNGGYGCATLVRRGTTSTASTTDSPTSDIPSAFRRMRRSNRLSSSPSTRHRPSKVSVFAGSGFSLVLALHEHSILDLPGDSFRTD